ncbi:hypothetical protein ACJEBK_28260 [Peribacillus frigoritolerans]|uniref:hypothetical protein n=1 Tax=Peribacillus frigoritolerans TaxID=450367 RepID=UPI003871DBDC
MTDVKVSPTPIQRNSLDVAMELTQMHKQLMELMGMDFESTDIAQTYAGYYALAQTLQRQSVDSLSGLVSDEILAVIRRSESSY